MRSAERTVDNRWAITSAVRPLSAASIDACTWASLSLSRWLVASSRIMTAGFFSSRRAIAIRCFSPPLNR